MVRCKVVLSMASASPAEIADRLVRVAHAAAHSLDEPLGTEFLKEIETPKA